MKNIKFYQASTSELFGETYGKSIFTEKSKFHPKSPYGVAKLYAYWITSVYRESYGIFACNGILFNHESPRRGETFVTRKIVIGLCKIKKNLQKKLYLGNIEAKRDWGHAKDYVEAMWKILQQKSPDDFVIATGKQYTVKQFVDLVLKELNIEFQWKGSGINSKCYTRNGKCIVACSKEYYRPLEVDTLLGNSRKAQKELNWKPKININQLVDDMISQEMISLELHER